MARGGKRPGAGRKPKAMKYQTEIARAEKQIGDRLPLLVENLIRLADGVTVQKETIVGTVVYTEPPDRAANVYLIDRILGKPTERHEVSGQDGEPLFPSHAQQDMLQSEEAIDLACRLDECLCRPASIDPGGIRAPR